MDRIEQKEPARRHHVATFAFKNVFFMDEKRDRAAPERSQEGQRVLNWAIYQWSSKNGGDHTTVSLTRVSLNDDRLR